MKNFSRTLLFTALLSIVLFTGCDDPMMKSLENTVMPGTDPSTPVGMVLIPAGTFEMGSDIGGLDEQPIHTVFLDAFYMDIYEVTNKQYQAFVLANPRWQKSNIDATLHDGEYLRHWNGNDYPEGTADHPVTFVSWYSAVAYAQWLGKRLPTEAEWEKAARGGLVGALYPWGNMAPDGTQCNFADASVADLFNWADTLVDDGYQYTAPVGSYLPNGYGLYDMAGNVYEWCLDEYDEEFYARSPRDNPLAGGNRIPVIDTLTNRASPYPQRGGSWDDATENLRAADRTGAPPVNASGSAGFRCVQEAVP